MAGVSEGRCVSACRRAAHRRIHVTLVEYTNEIGAGWHSAVRVRLVCAC